MRHCPLKIKRLIQNYIFRNNREIIKKKKIIKNNWLQYDNNLLYYEHGKNIVKDNISLATVRFHTRYQTDSLLQLYYYHLSATHSIN